jgi:hypothetical protein
VTVRDRHEELPAASYALTVSTVVPMYSGAVALHADVPDATPAAPVDDVHRTSATPLSSAAAPDIVKLAAVVSTFVFAGEVIRRAGGVVSPVSRGGGGGVTGGGGGGGGGSTGG